MIDRADGLSVLHVIVRAGPTNCQYNEHCLPVLDRRHVTVCSLFPADVTPPPGLTLHEGDGSVRGGARALRRALTSDTYDVVHVHAPASAMVTLAVYRRMRRPREDLVFTVHNSWRNFRFRNRLFLRLILRLFPLVVVCGQAAFESMPRRLARRAAGRLAVVPNGVDVQRVRRALALAPGAPQHRADGGLTVISVNRLIPLKDPGTLLRAFACLRGPHDRLVMVGDGPLRGRVEAEIRARDLAGCVTLTGIIPREDVYRRISEADVFVSTSGGEGLPVALLEAMACETPVVVSDIPPHREVSRAAGGLPLVELRDEAGFARAIQRLRALEPHERHTIGRRLGDVVAEHYSVEAMNAAYGALYRQQVERRSPGQDARASRRSRRGADAPLGEKLRRHVLALCVLTLLGGLAGFGVALVQTPVYKGETSVQVGSVAADEESLKANAALAGVYADLARREPVLAPLVDDGYADGWKQIQRDVYARVSDRNPQLVEISVYADDDGLAREMVDAVATSLERFVERSSRSDDDDFLQAQLRAIRSDVVATTQQLTDSRRALEAAPPAQEAALRARVDSLQGTLAEQRSGYTSLRTLAAIGAGTLTRVDEAWTARSPLRPTPLVLALAGAMTALLAGIAWLHLFGTGRPQPPAVPATTPHPHNPSTLRDLRVHRTGPPAPATGRNGFAHVRNQPEQPTRASEA
jgi:glycosyltransferase involved in cell wall biosynthesis/capsular polysaccharide biosynthesis protein